MDDRHREGMEAAIHRLEQVREELECHRDDHERVIERELQKVDRKKVKIVKKVKRDLRSVCNEQV
jgi:hypothetical protein